MQRISEIIREEGDGGESGVIRRRPCAAGTNRTSATGSNTTSRTSFMMSSLIRQSLAGASMLQQPEGAHCSLCARVHRGPCRVDAPSAPLRPKSVFVNSTSMDTDDDWPWMTRGVDNSRRASIDTSELGDGYYSSNIWDSSSFDPAATGNDKNKDKTAGTNQQQVATNKTPVDGPGEQQEEQAQLEYANNIDQGYAWVIVAVVFLINATTFGTARAYGYIFERLAREGGQSREEAATPFTVMGAIENMSGPVCGCLLALTGSWRLTVFGGSLLITLGHLFAAIWAQSQLGQLMSMGLITGFGLSFISISFFQVNNAYFVRYRTIAFGIGMCGSVFGTFVISPVCQYFLKNYQDTRMCYLVLSAFMAPNVPLSLLLKPINRSSSSSPPPQALQMTTSEPETSLSTSESSLATSGRASTVDMPVAERPQVTAIHHKPQQTQQSCEVKIDDVVPLPPHPQASAEQQVAIVDEADHSPWTWIKLVVTNPYFHLIWPTQMLFCWLNFVYGMIIVDFSKDRGMSEGNVARLVPVWAFGQLFGRLLLSSLVDLKLISNKSFTIICFLAIGITTWLLNNTQLISVTCVPAHYRDLIILALVFVMSMFIALLYILLNGLVVHYVEPALQPISFGISSFTGSFFLLPRARAIGHYRDTFGNYDALLAMFTYVCLFASFIWLVMPPTITYLKDLARRRRESKMVLVLQSGSTNCTNGNGHVNLATTIPAEDLTSVAKRTVTFGPDLGRSVADATTK